MNGFVAEEMQEYLHVCVATCGSEPKSKSRAIAEEEEQQKQQQQHEQQQ